MPTNIIFLRFVILSFEKRNLRTFFSYFSNIAFSEPICLRHQRSSVDFFNLIYWLNVQLLKSLIVLLCSHFFFFHFSFFALRKLNIFFNDKNCNLKSKFQTEKSSLKSLLIRLPTNECDQYCHYDNND